jgi:hypothetical protein
MSRALLDLKGNCPLSAVEIASKVIPPHPMNMEKCDNGTIYMICPRHMVRCFIGDKETTQEIFRSSSVVGFVGKEKPDGSPQEKQVRRRGARRAGSGPAVRADAPLGSRWRTGRA